MEKNIYKTDLNNIVIVLEKKLNIEQRRIEELEKELNLLPDGKLYIIVKCGRRKYYMKDDKGEHSLRKTNPLIKQLARKAGVGAVPGSSFFNEPINNIVRLHFAKKDETLYAALDRLNHIKDMM